MPAGFASLAGHFQDRTVVTYDPRGIGRSRRTDAARESTPERHEPLAGVINAADPVAAWDALELAGQRLLIDRFCPVTILPSGRKGHGFQPATRTSRPSTGWAAG
jgi:hypothetical protein